jgi:gliding motility-associated-like protein
VLDQGASSYTWVPLQYLTSPFSWNTGFFPPDTTDYILTVSNYCYTKSDSVLIIVWPSPQFGLNPLDSICAGDSIQLNATGATNYAWTPGATLSDSTISNPFAAPLIATKYIVSGTNQYGCFNKDSTFILVYQPSLIQVGTVRPWYCLGDTIPLQVTGSNFYQWSPPGTLNYPDSSNPVAFPLDTTTYYVVATNIHGCQTSDSVLVNVQLPITFNAPDLYQVCKGTPVQLEANGGLYYSWWPDSTLKNPLTNDPFATPDSTTLYKVKISNDCFADTVSVEVVIYQLPYVDAGPDTTIWRDTYAQLHGTTFVTNYFWEPSTWLQYAFNLNTNASPPQTTWYYLFATDSLGCRNVDSVLITVIAHVVLDIPTGFSPNGDGMNDVFHIVKYLDIRTLNEFAVFDRWGEKVFSTDNIEVGWDGTYRGKPAPVGVYVWTVVATTNEGDEIMRKGNVSLIR